MKITQKVIDYYNRFNIYLETLAGVIIGYFIAMIFVIRYLLKKRKK